MVEGTAVRDGRSTRWDPHRRERRSAIIAAAVEAIEEFGPDALTAQIAEKAGVPRTHVYRHFEGKEALDRAVSRHLANDIGARLRDALRTGGTTRQLITASIEAHLGWITAHPHLYRFLAQHAWAVRSTGAPAIDDAKAAFAAELTALIQRYMISLGVDTEPAERVVVGIVGLVDATAAWWLERGTPARHVLTAELSEQVWLLLERAARGYGLELDPDAPLPAID